MTSNTETEIEKSLDYEGAVLQGTLRLPSEGPVSHAVLMITGSGEIDRNENGMQMQLNTFNSLADSLAEAGIASLRFDKRGCASSGGKYHETGFYDYVDDAHAWVNELDSYPELEGAKRFAMGHAEGALIAGFLSERSSKLDGLILLTPFVENVEKAIERQLQQTLDEVSVIKGFKGTMVRFFLFMGGNQIKRQRKLMARIKNSQQPSFKVKKTLLNAKWLREVTSVNPVQVYQKVKLATLAIGGAKDIQCLPEDTKQIATLIDAPVEALVLSDMTHIMRSDEEAPSAFRNKALAELPIDSRVPEAIIDWLGRQ